jgi:uncharacterized protein YcbX
VDGVPAFDEDTWRIIRIGEVVFHVVKPCCRCKATTVDPKTGVMDQRPQPQPLAELTQFRQDKATKLVMFGQNLLAANEGVVRPGDRVFVIERGAPNFEALAPAGQKAADQGTVSTLITTLEAEIAEFGGGE